MAQYLHSPPAPGSSAPSPALRIAITGGGTGGHVFPAISIIERLEKRMAQRQGNSLDQMQPALEIFWFGSKRGMERGIVEREIQKRRGQSYSKIIYYPIPCGKLRRYFSLRNFWDVFRTAAGVLVSYFALRRIRPQLVFSKGGFVSVPPVLAAHFLGLPCFSHESDLDPGLATRISAGFVDLLFVPYEQSISHFHSKYHQKILVTGNPVRLEFFPTKNADSPGYNPHIPISSILPEPWFGKAGQLSRPLLLILGGSLGAHEINTWVEFILPQTQNEFYLFHQCGKGDFPACHTWEEKYSHYRVEAFVTEGLSALYQKSSLIITRSGAGTLWEILASQSRAILVPLIVGSRGDQLRNAQFFEQQGWASCFLGEKDDSVKAPAERNAIKLLAQIREILQDKERKPATPLPQMDAAALLATILESACEWMSVADLPRRRTERWVQFKNMALQAKSDS